MVFLNQFDAKKFFVEKIIQKAKKEGTPLSEAQQYVLNWTDVEEGFQVNEELNKKFIEETSDEDYERKICTLLRLVYEEDVTANPTMKETYRNAYRAMAKNDHYILVMIREALGRKIRRLGWLFPLRENYFFKLLIGRSWRFWAKLILIVILLIPFRLTVAPERIFRIADINGLPIPGAKIRYFWSQEALRVHGDVMLSPSSNGEVLSQRRTVWTNLSMLVVNGGAELIIMRHGASIGSYDSARVFAEGYKDKWIYDGKWPESGVIVLEKVSGK